MRNPTAAPPLCHNLYHLFDSLPSYPVFFPEPGLVPFLYLASWIAVAQNSNVMIGILQNRLTSRGEALDRKMFLDYEWRREDPQGKYL